MAFKLRGTQINPGDLQALLVRSGLNTNTERGNAPLYQTINSLIGIVQEGQGILATTLKVGDEIPASQITGRLDPANGGSFSGSYVPVGTLVTNLSAIGFNYLNYYRIGDVVHVSGVVVINPVATGLWEGRFTLPILSYFLRTWDASGVGTSVVGETGAITADITNFELFISGTAIGTAQFDMQIQADYRLIAQTVSP